MAKYDDVGGGDIWGEEWGKKMNLHRTPTLWDKEWRSMIRLARVGSTLPPAPPPMEAYSKAKIPWAAGYVDPILATHPLSHIAWDSMKSFFMPLSLASMMFIYNLIKSNRLYFPTHLKIHKENLE